MAVRSTFAHLTENTPNYHQATVFFLTTDAEQDAEMRAKAPRMFCFGALMIVLQWTAVCGIWIGSSTPSCSIHDQCSRGKFCEPTFGRCAFCGAGAPIPRRFEDSCELQTNAWGGTWSVESSTCQTLNEPMDPSFIGYNLTLVATTCAHPPADDSIENAIMGTSGFGYPLPWTRSSVSGWCEMCVRS